MKISLKHSLLLFLAVVVTALAGSGCQTAKGFGEDVENLGEKIQKP